MVIWFFSGQTDCMHDKPIIHCPKEFSAVRRFDEDRR